MKQITAKERYNQMQTAQQLINASVLRDRIVSQTSSIRGSLNFNMSIGEIMGKYCKTEYFEHSSDERLFISDIYRNGYESRVKKGIFDVTLLRHVKKEHSGGDKWLHKTAYSEIGIGDHKHYDLTQLYKIGGSKRNIWLLIREMIGKPWGLDFIPLVVIVRFNLMCMNYELSYNLHNERPEKNRQISQFQINHYIVSAISQAQINRIKKMCYDADVSYVVGAEFKNPLI